MHALVNEARLAVVLVFTGPVGHEVIVERGAALGAAARGLPLQFLHHRGNGLELLGDDKAAHVVMAIVGAAAHRGDGAGL